MASGRSRSRSPRHAAPIPGLEVGAGLVRVTIGTLAGAEVAALDVLASATVRELQQRVAEVVGRPLPQSRWRLIHSAGSLPAPSSLLQAGVSQGAHLLLSEADNLMLLTASSDDTAKIWDKETGECVQTLQGHGCRVISAVFS